jgi:hypothetical protein
VRNFKEQLETNFQTGKEERPTALRSNVVERYIMEILGSQRAFKEKENIVSKMIELRCDNRVLNQMRETMNNKIEDENGLMSIEAFKKMFYTAHGR